MELIIRVTQQKLGLKDGTINSKEAYKLIDIFQREGASSNRGDYDSWILEVILDPPRKKNY